MVIVLELLEFMILHLCFYSNCSAVHCIIYEHVSRCKFNIFYDKKFDLLCGIQKHLAIVYTNELHGLLEQQNNCSATIYCSLISQVCMRILTEEILSPHVKQFLLSCFVINTYSYVYYTYSGSKVFMPNGPSSFSSAICRAFQALSGVNNSGA